MTPDAKVGMFWCVGETVVAEAVPLSEAEPYGDALQYGGHYDFWLHLKPQTDAERLLKGHAYDYYPRGRVVYFLTKRQFRLYMDGCLTAGNRQAIIEYFGLAGVPIELKRDEHYQCARCNRDYLE
ncbi:MAG: hypothetical protein R2940_10215 [Syntrophotaleaceae bacterium]